MDSYILCDELPQDVVREILTRLSVKSLTRFESLSKGCSNLIKSSSFIADHLHHSTHKKSYLLLTSSRGLYFLPNKCLENLNSLAPFPVQGFQEFDVDLKVVGCSNGLICVLHDFSNSSNRLSIWNPATRKVRPIYFLTYHLCWAYNLGFGFGSNEKDYKIVMVPKRNSPRPNPDVMIFSLATGSWKQSQHASLSSVILQHVSTMANGTLYWKAKFKEDASGEWRNVIISFDLGQEVFKKITMPTSNNYYYVNHDDIGLAVYNDSLAVFLYDEQNPKYAFDLWVFQNNDDDVGESWTKVCNFTVAHQLVRGIEQPLAIWKNLVIFRSIAYPTDATDGDSQMEICEEDSFKGQRMKVSTVYDFFVRDPGFVFVESLVPV